MSKPSGTGHQPRRDRPAKLRGSLLRPCVALLALLSAGTVMAAGKGIDRHALLIGVSDYPRIDARHRLQGPRNDVALMHRVLLERGFPAWNIRVLADGTLGDRKPTRDAILSELKNLAEHAGKGSYVYIHFSGHGSRQPCPISSAQREPDGMDELILPYDASHWDQDLGTVRKAIIDDELREAIDAIRAGGAFVWAVFDSCHSGSVTRAFTPQYQRERRVPASALGVPVRPRALRGADPAHSHGRGAEQTALDLNPHEPKDVGGLVTFFASQPYETTFERKLPSDSLDARPHGLFSYTLASILSETPNISYRQAAQGILQRYAKDRRVSPTPLFWGSDLDAPVFGTSGGPPIHQWPLERHRQRLLLRAGRLQGIDKGTLLAVLRTPTAEAQQVIGYVEVTAAQMLDSQVRPVDYKGRTALAPILFPAHAYARLERASLSLELLVARPPPSRHPEDERIRRLLSRLSGHATGSEMTVRVRWADPDEPADVRLFLQGHRLWILPPSAELNPSGPGRTPGIGLEQNDDELLAQLRQVLQSIAKVTNLLRLASLNLGKPSPVPLSTSIRIQRLDGSDLLFRPEHVPALRHGDKLFVTLSNAGEKPIDATVLFVDGRYGLHALFPVPGEANRIQKGEPVSFGTEIITQTETAEGITVGRERLLIIATEGKGQYPANFAFLAQERLRPTRSSSDRAAYRDLYEFLELAGFSQTATRSALQLESRSIDRVRFEIFTWDSLVE